MARKPWTSHGLSGHPLYTVWQDMVRRCHSPADARYPWYGARSVTVCDEWRENPQVFITWALENGWEPGKQIDKDRKIPGNKLYAPDRCSIVSRRENMLAVVSRESGRKTSKLKLSCEDVADIVRRKDDGVTTRQLAAEYAVDIGTINRAYRLTKRA